MKLTLAVIPGDPTSCCVHDSLSGSWKISRMKYAYAHLPPDQDIGFDSRSYSVTEALLEYKGRQVLYLHVVASDITFCDRSYASHLVSLNVKGYVAKWKYVSDESGVAVSEIEPVGDEEQRQEIREILRSRHSISTINFV